MTVLMGHQPLFVGSAEWWSRIAAADVFVLNDLVDYEPKSAQSRHVLDGRMRIVPLVHEGEPRSIRGTSIALTDPLWRKLVRSSVEMWPREPHRALARALLAHALQDGAETGSLGRMTVSLARRVHAVLGLRSSLVLGSVLNDRLGEGFLAGTILGQCVAARADQYWCGVSGKEYLPLEQFTKWSVGVFEVAYDGPDGDVPVLDLIARHGPAARELLGTCRSRSLVQEASSADAS
jgi:WbqC-like protein family